MRDLSHVALCAADSVNVRATARALARSQHGCRFAEAVLFSDQPAEGPFRRAPIAPMRSREDYNAFMLEGLPQHVTTPFALVVQWDGFVADPAAWLDHFCDYDYIGAHWFWYEHDHDVGNGGFSLRSRKLLRALAQLRPVLTRDIPEDEQICIALRPLLESDFGIRFAPRDVANCFSYERASLQGPVFGFHGAFNLFRHYDAADLCALAAELNAVTIRSHEYAELIVKLVELRLIPQLRPLYRRWCEELALRDCRERLGRVLAGEETVTLLLNFCDRVLAV
jgi:hypothetical protein